MVEVRWWMTGAIHRVHLSSAAIAVGPQTPFSGNNGLGKQLGTLSQQAPGAERAPSLLGSERRLQGLKPGLCVSAAAAPAASAVKYFLTWSMSYKQA